MMINFILRLFGVDGVDSIMSDVQNKIDRLSAVSGKHADVAMDKRRAAKALADEADWHVTESNRAHTIKGKFTKLFEVG
jgi:hypothetical protein